MKAVTSLLSGEVSHKRHNAKRSVSASGLFGFCMDAKKLRCFLFLVAGA